MGSRFFTFDVTGPANTPITAPVEVALPVPVASPGTVWIVIPDGHAGLTGIALAVAHQPIIPENAGAYIAGNDEVLKIELIGYPDSGQWSAFLYNTDTQDHSWEVRFDVTAFGLAEAGFQPSQPTPAIALEAPAEQPAATGELPAPVELPPPETTQPLAPTDQGLTEAPTASQVDGAPPVEDQPVPDIPLPPDLTPPDEPTLPADTVPLIPDQAPPAPDGGVALAGPPGVKDRDLGPTREHLGRERTAPHRVVRVTTQQIRYRPSSVLFGHPEVKPDVAAIVNTIRHFWPGLIITSTLRKSSCPNSYHCYGEAVDLAAGVELMHHAAVWCSTVLFEHLTEGIHNTGLSVKNGVHVAPAYWGAVTWAAHANHIHVAVGSAQLGTVAGRVLVVGSKTVRETVLEPGPPAHRPAPPAPRAPAHPGELPSHHPPPPPPARSRPRRPAVHPTPGRR